MVVEKDQYAPKFTDMSRMELIRLARWYNTGQGGNWPTVIGGWAVWSYHKNGFGSRDVDLIFPTGEWIDEMMIKTYFPGNGFVKYMRGDPILGTPHYGKPMDDENIVFFDLISAELPREDTVGMGVNVDWNWVYEDQRVQSIGDGASINVPSLEFLITLKIIGCISRKRKMQRVVDNRYFQSKIWKDCHDIAKLTNLSPDDSKLLGHFKQTGLTGELVEEFITICDKRQSALKEAESEMGPLESMRDLY